jgi:hypothetical protein
VRTGESNVRQLADTAEYFSGTHQRALEHEHALLHVDDYQYD